VAQGEGVKAAGVERAHEAGLAGVEPMAGDDCF
jgi:hypothetical protein